MKLAIVTTHPIQYYAPVFQLMATRFNLKVFYTWGTSAIRDTFDPDFGKNISWDIPLLEGYEYEFLENTAASPGSGHFKGIQNPQIIQKIEAFQPDAVLVYGWSYQSHLKVIRHFKGELPVWFRGDSNLLDTQGFLKKIARSILLRWVYSYVDRAFYVGTANKDYFKQYGLKENQLVFAPHAVDNDRFAEDRLLEALTLRKSLNIPDDAMLILFAGKLEPKKDPDLLLKAFLEFNHPNAYLLFVGNGILEEKLRDFAVDERQTLNVKHNLPNSKLLTPNSKLIFLPFQNQTQMPVIYQLCDLFCLPSKGPGETWGLAVNEAMASKKAVLTSDQVGCSKDLVLQENGLTFEAQNLTSLITSLKKLLSNRDDLKCMGMASFMHIKDWSFDKMVNAFESALISLKKS